MDIDWMIKDELAQAIPPVYTEFIGRRLLEQMERSGLVSAMATNGNRDLLVPPRSE